MPAVSGAGDSKESNLSNMSNPKANSDATERNNETLRKMLNDVPAAPVRTPFDSRRSREKYESIRQRAYDVSTCAFEPFKKYLVFVAGRGWTDGEYRTDSPQGWCHKWALDDSLFSHPARGVTHFADMIPNPSTSI